MQDLELRSGNFLFEKNSFKLNKMSWNLSETPKTEKEFFNGDMSIIETRNNYNIDLVSNKFAIGP